MILGMMKTRVSVVAVGAAMAMTATVMTIAPAQSAPSVQTGTTKATPLKSVSHVSSGAALGKRRTTVTAKASARSVVVLQPANIKGKVNGPNKRRVVLQLKNAYGWGNVDKDKTNKSGKYKLEVPTKWYGKKKMRVVAPPTRRFQADKNKVEVKVTEGYAPAGAKKSWTRLAPYKARYNPCQKISYAFNQSNLPADGVAVFNEAIFRVELASGLRYKFAGSTKAIPFRSGGGKDRDKKSNLSIAYSNASVVPPLGGSVLAVGGFNDATRIAKRDTYKLTKTGVVIDVDYAYADRGFLNGASMGAVAMHELTHATGMGHAQKDPAQIMFPTIDPARAALFGRGDINGLDKHGRDAGCLSPGNARPAVDAQEITPVWMP